MQIVLRYDVDMIRMGLILAVLSALLAGCAGMPADSRRDLASTDHAECAGRGYSWPGPRYVDCRYHQAERRHQRDWQNLNLARMPRIDQSPERPAEAYRPLNRAIFTCAEMTDENGASWVDCGPQR